MAIDLYYRAVSRYRLLNRADKYMRARWYRYFSRLSRPYEIGFINLGYAQITGEQGARGVEEGGASDRQAIQLYRYTVGPIDLSGKRVLEVGCGHGGGAAYLSREHAPREMIGLDSNAAAIQICRARHASGSLSFRTGDAQALPFGDARFDAIVNIESSHCYLDPGMFFREAARVLQPGGDLMFADFRARDKLPCLVNQISAAGLELVSKQDISQNVRLSIEQTSALRLQQARALLPRLLRPAGLQFAGVTGSHIHAGLSSGEIVYVRCHLKKQRRSPPNAALAVAG